MNSEDEDDRITYTVVVNHDEQYSIWPANRELPLGWHPVGKTGRKAECLEYIDLVWKDMRPLSVRKHLEQSQNKASDGQDTIANDGPLFEEWNAGPSLVESLSVGRHAVEAALRPEKTAATLKECIDRGFVPIRFTQTRGGTELGLKLDTAASDVDAADFENGKGTVHLEGELTLDHIKVRCIVDLNVATLRGDGHLVPVIERLP
jgi:uncharacterized protein YbdZ (MbtH family)